MDIIPEPQVESRFPDCVVMKLHLEEVAQPGSAGFVTSPSAAAQGPAREARMHHTKIPKSLG